MTDPHYLKRVEGRGMTPFRASVEVSRLVHASAEAVRDGRLDRAEWLLASARAVVLGQADRAGAP